MVAIGAAPAETATPAADGKALEYCIIHLFSFLKKLLFKLLISHFFANVGTTPAEGAPPAADAAAPPPPADGKSRNQRQLTINLIFYSKLKDRLLKIN